MTNPYPLPRETRETEIFTGDGVSATYGPFLWKIFDQEDVSVETNVAGSDLWIETAVVIDKVADLPFDYFTITFPAPLAATTKCYVKGDRLGERTTDLTRGGTINSNELEKETSKQVVSLQELRRDMDRALAFPPGYAGSTKLPPGDASKILGWNTDGTALVNKTGVEIGVAGAAGAEIFGFDLPAEVRDYLNVEPGIDVMAYSAILAAIVANGTPGVAGLANLLASNYSAVLATPVDATVTDAKLASALSNNLVTVCTSAAAAKAVNTTRYTMLFRKSATAGASGLFGWRTGDYTARIAADTTEAIFFKADAIAASAGAWVRIEGGWALGQFKPEWFGAVPDWNGATGTDNAPAFNAMYAMRTVLPLTNIIIGAGAFKFSSRLVWTFVSGQHCTIQGQGWDATQLVFIGNTSGGIFINYEGDVRQNGSSIKTTGFSVITDQDPSVTWVGLGFKNTPFAEGMTQPGPVVRDVIVRGITELKGPTYGFWFEDCCSLTVENCWALGKASDYTMVAFNLLGGTLNRWADHRFVGCKAYWYNRAVAINKLAEGIVIDKCLFVAGRVGVEDLGEADRPLHLSITNTHINADTACVRSFTGGANFFASGNLFYEWGNNTGDWFGISLADYVEVNIHDNHTTTWPLARNKVGVQLGNVTRAFVHHNTYRGVTDPITTGVIATGTDINVDDNFYVNCTTRNNVTGTRAYSRSAKAVATANSASITSVGEKVVSINHGLGVVPTRDWFTVELVSGSCVPLVGRIGSRSSTITDVVVYVPSWTSNAVVKVTYFSEAS